MNFAEILPKITAGHIVSREGWELGAYMYLLNSVRGGNHLVKAFFQYVMPWVVMEEDLIAEDWVEVSRPEGVFNPESTLMAVQKKPSGMDWNSVMLQGKAWGCARRISGNGRLIWLAKTETSAIQFTNMAIYPWDTKDSDMAATDWFIPPVHEHASENFLQALSDMCNGRTVYLENSENMALRISYGKFQRNYAGGWYPTSLTFEDMTELTWKKLPQDCELTVYTCYLNQGGEKTVKLSETKKPKKQLTGTFYEMSLLYPISWLRLRHWGANHWLVQIDNSFYYLTQDSLGPYSFNPSYTNSDNWEIIPERLRISSQFEHMLKYLIASHLIHRGDTEGIKLKNGQFVSGFNTKRRRIAIPLADMRQTDWSYTK